MSLRNAMPVIHKMMNPDGAPPGIADDRLARIAAKLSNVWMWIGIGVATIVFMAQ